MPTFRFDGEVLAAPDTGLPAALVICYACNGVKKPVLPPDPAGFAVDDEIDITDEEILVEIRKDPRFTEL